MTGTTVVGYLIVIHDTKAEYSYLDTTHLWWTTCQQSQRNAQPLNLSSIKVGELPKREELFIHHDTGNSFAQCTMTIHNYSGRFLGHITKDLPIRWICLIQAMDEKKT